MIPFADRIDGGQKDRKLCSLFSNSMMLGLAAGGGSIYRIARSVRFNPPDSAYLARTPGSAGNRRLWTFSAWLKRSNLGTLYIFFNGNNGGSGTGPNNVSISFSASDQIQVSWLGYELITTAVFRDPTSWMHLVVNVDIDNVTAGLRGRIWVNGVEITAFALDQRGSWSGDGWVNSTGVHSIGRMGNGSYYFDGYITEVTFVDGQALTASSFGEASANGAWVPKRFSGSFGTNGFQLDFSDNSGATSSTLGKDRSGNNNDWTPTNISVAAGVGNDSLTDTPTPYDDGTVRGDFCTLQRLDTNGGSSIANGNLDINNAQGQRGSFYVNSGKWAYEVTLRTAISGSCHIGWSEANQHQDPATSNPSGVFYTGTTGNKLVNSTSSTAYGASFTNGDTVRCEIDFDNNQVEYFKNGTSQGVISWTKVAGKFYSPHIYAYVCDVSLNFGQRPFANTPTSGFKALCTANLPTPSILTPSKHFATTLYTGTAATLGVTGVGFQPDLAWIKSRSAATNHNLFDSTRGVQKGLQTSSTAAEYSDAATLTSFDADGFSLGADGSSRGVNANAATYVSWCWKKGVTPGFDIVSDQGTGSAHSINHSLGVAPHFIVRKNRDTAGLNWLVYHRSLGGTKNLKLNTTEAQDTNVVFWNNTDPNGSTFTVGTNGAVNENTKNFITYLWVSVDGFSLFSSYTGNGSSDGPMVPCGFRPELVIIKRVDASYTWVIHDAARVPFNVNNKQVYPPYTSAEQTGGDIDILACGFKVRVAELEVNTSGGTYIFMAWAKNPFKYAPAS